MWLYFASVAAHLGDGLAWFRHDVGLIVGEVFVWHCCNRERLFPSRYRAISALPA
jgi:hypothetical protein